MWNYKRWKEAKWLSSVAEVSGRYRGKSGQHNIAHGETGWRLITCLFTDFTRSGGKFLKGLREQWSENMRDGVIRHKPFYYTDQGIFAVHTSSLVAVVLTMVVYFSLIISVYKV